MDKIDAVVAKITKDFEEKPVATTLKGLALLYIAKKVIKWLD